MPCFFYVTNSVYMEQKPETGKSTDKTKNACYTSTIKANEKKITRRYIVTMKVLNSYDKFRKEGKRWEKYP